MAKQTRGQAEAQILEQGNIYFMYRPRIEHEEAAGADEVQRFYMVLKPHGKRRYRLMVIGRKHIPALPRQSGYGISSI